MSEEWRRVKDWPEYQVSDRGRIKRVIGRSGTQAGRVLKPVIRAGGYLYVTLRRPGQFKNVQLHRLVCEAFNGSRPTDHHFVAHNNGIPPDCAATNLRWATLRDNSADRLLHGTDARGAKSPCAKLTEMAVEYIRSFPPRRVVLSDLAEQYGVCEGTIKGARYAKKWKHVERRYDQ